MRSATAALTAGSLLCGGLLFAAPSLANAATVPQPDQLLTKAEAKQRPVLRRGDRSHWVRRLNRALSVKPARKVFRKKTARAVRAFRTNHDMRARPVVNVRTWRLLGDAVPVPKPKPAADPTPPPSAPAPGVLGPELRPGALSIWVVALQQTLGVSPTSGYFGPLTEAAVKDLQSGSNLPATGVVTAATWNLLGGVTAPAVDPTRTAAARDSAQHRKDLGVAAFVASWTASAVVDRESGGNCAIVSYNGAWRGKWQMDASFWATYGGTEFAAAPEAATCAQQDLVAYNGWVDRWWWPWKKEAFPQ